MAELLLPMSLSTRAASASIKPILEEDRMARMNLIAMAIAMAAGCEKSQAPSAIRVPLADPLPRIRAEAASADKRLEPWTCHLQGATSALSSLPYAGTTLAHPTPTGRHRQSPGGMVERRSALIAGITAPGGSYLESGGVLFWPVCGGS